MKKDKKEVEYKEKAGTAWSHAYLNQKPWHPLSYPNQRRKWIAEQTHAQKEERSAEVAREFAQEQEFFRQTAQMSKKEKEKMEVMQAVSFMYMRPPGYNAEAARAAEIADERKRLGLITAAEVDATPDDGNISTGVPKRKTPRAKDVFGRTLPTEQEFPSLRDAPRHDTGAPTRVKPFAIEIRNVKCARCGAFGHQSGDRECPLKDVLMPSEEARLIREDPLNTILAQTTSDELLTWELKQKPGGLSPARGGFKPNDPNQQIIPDEDIYDEYGGFLPGGGDEGTLSIPSLLASLSHEQRKELTDNNSDKKRKHKKERKVKRKDKRLDSRKSAHSGDHNPGRDGRRDDRESSSSEGKQRYQKPRKGAPHSSKDDNKIHFDGDGKSDGSGDDQGSHQCMGRKEFDLLLSSEKNHPSKGMRLSDKTDDITKDRFNINVEYQGGTRRKNTHRKGDGGMDNEVKPYKVRYKNRRDTFDDEQRRFRDKDRRGSSDSEHRIRKYEDRRDSSAHEQRRVRYINNNHDEPLRARYKNKMHSIDVLQTRLGHKDRDSSDDEQRRFRQKERMDSSDHEHRRLRHKDRRDSIDEQERRLRQKDRMDSSDDERRRLRHKDRKDNSDEEERRLRQKYRMDNSDAEQTRPGHKDRRDSSDQEERRLRQKYRRDSSDDEQRRLRHKDRRDSRDEEERTL